MGKKRLFTGNTPLGGKSLKSRRLARRVTSKFHDTRNQLAIIEKRNDLSESEKDRLRQEMKLEIENIGGIDAYQQASVISTQHFNTSKWILKTYNQLIVEKKVTVRTHVSEATKDKRSKPKVLEVGAINTYLAKQSSLDIRCIDINSQHPLIEERDFFTVLPEQLYDAVVCSMVINCVPEPDRRGEMLCRLVMQIHPGGVLFLVLPRRCVCSPAVGESRFESLLAGLGCVHLAPKRVTPRIVFYILGRRTEGLHTGLDISHSSSSSRGSRVDALKPSKSEKTGGMSLQPINQTLEPWELQICENMKIYMDNDTLRYFSSASHSRRKDRTDQSNSNHGQTSDKNRAVSSIQANEQSPIGDGSTFSLYIPLKYVLKVTS